MLFCVDSLDSWALRDAITAAQQRLVYCPLEGVTGSTKAMAEAAKRDRQARNAAAEAASRAAGGGEGGGGGGASTSAKNGGVGGNDDDDDDDDAWAGTAVGHGRRQGTYRERDEGLLAAKQGDLSRLRRLVEQDGWDPVATVDSLGSCALHWAAGNGHLEVCR